MFHHIQKAVLDTLATAESCRYSELKPATLDGNVFTYHLKQLLTDKYVEKDTEGNYFLTPKGKDYIVHRYEDRLEQAHSIFLIALRHGDAWLLRERKVQPLLGMVGFIHGEPIASEPLLETAKRRLKEKTGLSTDLTLLSSGLIRNMRHNQCESFSHALIIYGELPSSDIEITEDATGRQCWMTTNEMSNAQVQPSCLDIITRITIRDTTPFDLRYELPASQN